MDPSAPSSSSRTTHDSNNSITESQINLKLATAHKERDAALEQLAFLRDQQAYLDNALKQALDNLDAQMHYYQAELACLRQVEARRRVEEEGRRREVEEVLGDLRCVVRVLQDENAVLKNDIGVLLREQEKQEKEQIGNRDAKSVKGEVPFSNKKAEDDGIPEGASACHSGGSCCIERDFVDGAPDTSTTVVAVCQSPNTTNTVTSDSDTQLLVTNSALDSDSGLSAIIIGTFSDADATATNLNVDVTLTNDNITIASAPRINTTTSSSSTAQRALRRGTDIRFTGFSYPKKHVVPDCVPERNGVHRFLGTGSNTHYTRFSCSYCGFICKERKPQYS
uniref:Uncharacterized protein n=1 Tax=Psilocybe cubensis TaxID=181762 RepID=A0A8H7Y062_PSICU